MAVNVRRHLAAQRAFVADASHQLRNPLTALRLRLSNLHGHVDTAAAEDHLDALAETDRLSILLDGLLAIARTEPARSAYPSTSTGRSPPGSPRGVRWSPRRTAARARRSPRDAHGRHPGDRRDGARRSARQRGEVLPGRDTRRRAHRRRANGVGLSVTDTGRDCSPTSSTVRRTASGAVQGRATSRARGSGSRSGPDPRRRRWRAYGWSSPEGVGCGWWRSCRRGTPCRSGRLSRPCSSGSSAPRRGAAAPAASRSRPAGRS